MADIDLIPRQYVLRKRLQRRIKTFAAGALVLVCAVSAARGALWYSVGVEEKEIARLRKNELDSAQLQARMQAYQQQKTDVEKQLKGLADVRGRGRVNLLLQALDGAHLHGVWFDEIRSYRTGVVTQPIPTEAVVAAPRAAGAPSQPAPPPTQAAGAAPPAEPARTQQRVEIVGHALDHPRLATLMTRLSAQPGIAEVRLVDSATGASNNANTIDFKVALTVREQP